MQPLPPHGEGGVEVNANRYARRHQHVIDLALSGKKRGEIADELGLSRDSVGRVLSKARQRSLLPPARRPIPTGVTIGPRVRREDETIRLAREGIPPREIAVHLGCAVATVYHYLNKARHEGTFSGRFKPGGFSAEKAWTSYLSRDLAERLRPVAAGRGMTLDDLTRSILTKVAEDNLVDAVLDDADDRRAAHG
jgi:DNA-binding CsgD family transcriptional regulator